MWTARFVSGPSARMRYRHHNPTLPTFLPLSCETAGLHHISVLTDQGYALIEFATKEEAERAIKETSGTEFLEKTIHT